MEPNLKTFPETHYRDDSLHLASRSQLLSYLAKMINWKRDLEAELIAKVKRTKDAISMGEKLLTADILGLDYPTFFREILGEEDV